MESWKMRRLWGRERKIISRVESHKRQGKANRRYARLPFLFALSFLKGQAHPFRTWTAVMMRPDSGQILAKIPSFILISCFPFAPLVASPPHCNPIHTGPRPLIALRLLPQDALSLALSIVSATPRGPSSRSTTLRCSIYKRSFPKRARFFQPAGDKFLDLAFSFLDGTTFTIALRYCSRVSDRAIMRSVRNEKCMFSHWYYRENERKVIAKF